MQQIKDKPSAVPSKPDAVLFKCPVCKADRELVVELVDCTGYVPVKRGKEGYYWDFSETNDISFTPRYACQGCGYQLPLGIKLKEILEGKYSGHCKES